MTKLQQQRSIETTTRNNTEHQISFRWFIFSLPVVSSLLSFIACLIAYRVGVDDGLLQPLPFIPFISDIGDVQPASSIFTFFLILSSLITLIITAVRYYQVVAQNNKRSIQRLNTASLISAFIFLICKIGVSSFQLSSYKKVHLGFAFFYFLGATLYTAFQVGVTFKLLGGFQELKKLIKGDCAMKCQSIIFLSRLICCLALIVNFLIVAVFVTVPSLEVHNRGGANVGQSAEWAFAGFKLFFFSTFSYEFWKIRFTFAMKFDSIEKSINSSSPPPQSPHDVEDGRGSTNIPLTRLGSQTPLQQHQPS